MSFLSDKANEEDKCLYLALLCRDESAELQMTPLCEYS